MKSLAGILIGFFLLIYSGFSQDNITAMEYYIDTDPGVGNGTAVSITSAATQDVTFQVSTSSLSLGFHELVVRTQDASGDWGVHLSKTFYVSASSVTSNAMVSQIEYFFDTDPGIGNGTSLSITAGETIDLDAMIATSSLSEGFHELVFRAQDDAGVWGMQQSRTFYFTGSSTTSDASISKVEYFFDTDPGVGNGTELTITTGTTIDLDAMIATSSLSAGFHELVIRAQDASGLWGMQKSRTFYVTGASTGSDEMVTKIEYYFDTDPGIGNGTELTISPSMAIDMDVMLSTASLSEGFHEIVVRAQGASGEWGIQKSRTFYLSESSSSSPVDIVELEYFFDDDPGFGNGRLASVGPSTAIDVDLVVSTTSLSSGFHQFSIRARNDNGTWGATKTLPLYIDNIEVASGDGPISSIEYFIDTDPGIGNGTEISISPAEANVDRDFTVSTSSLADGNYSIGVRVGDTNGNYSITEMADFTICTAPNVDFSATTVCVGTATDFTDLSTGTMTGDTYSWDFDGDGNEDATTEGDATFTYGLSGTYTASLTIDQAGCFATREVIVTVVEIPSADAGSDQNISTLDNTTLSAVPAPSGETGVWSVVAGTGTFSDVNDPTATVSGLTIEETQLRWTVTNDAGGCSSFDDVSIFRDLLSDEAEILTFTLTEQTGPATINSSTATVDIEVVRGTDLSSLSPTIGVSMSATLSPTSGSVQDFSIPIVYTVTAEDGVTTKDWTVTVTELLSSEADILTFTFTEQSGVTSINTTSNTVDIQVLDGTDVTSLIPTITVSDGATINPASGIAQDFSSSVSYTVTAEDGVATKTWTVTVGVDPTTATDIISFVLDEETRFAEINLVNHTVEAEVVRGTNLAALTPTLVISTGASISPQSGVPQNFTAPVVYTVTGQNGITTQAWTVTVTEAPSSETDILSFTLSEQTTEAEIDFDNHTVNALVELGTDLSALTPTVIVSEGASVTPSGTQDFTNAVTYTVTAADGITTQNWSVTVAERPLGFEQYDVEIYPNPTKDRVFIRGIEEEYALFLIDLSGKRTSLGKNTKEISLDGYPSGLYMLSIEIEGSTTLRFRVMKD